jgi:hypothetical protein
MMRMAVLLWGLWVGSVWAQVSRDPTAPPADAGVALPPGAVSAAADEPPPPMSVVQQNGVPYLVVGTRLVAVGQKVGKATLERITETEIWLRDGRQLRKFSRYAGIQRTSVPEPGTCERPAARPPRRSASSKPVTPVAPCTGAQP